MRARTIALLILAAAVILIAPPIVLRYVAPRGPRDPVLHVAPAAITLSVIEKQAAAPQTLTIQNAGRGPLRWTVAPPADPWAAAAPAAGTNTGTVVVSLHSDRLAVGVHHTTIRIDSNGGAKVIPVDLTVSAREPPPDPPTPPDPSARGPQPSIVCPAGAVAITPAENIQTVINAHPAGTIYCLKPGTWTPTAPIRPKAGDTLQGEYGATINGGSVQSGEGGGISVISGWNCSSCANITVRNLVITGRDLINCVGAYGMESGGWLVEQNEIRGCRWGINSGTAWQTQIPQTYIRGWRVRSNILADHRWAGATGSDGSGAYGFQNGDDILFENNEVRGSGGQPKFTSTRRSIVRGNWLHHNGVGIWHDGDNTDALIEGNIAEDNCGEGIFYEISASGTIRGNTVRRNGHGCQGSGIFVSTSHEVTITGNTVQGNFRDVNLYVNCPNVKPAGYYYPTQIEWDLRNVTIQDNQITVGTPEFTVWGSSFSYYACTAAELSAYADPGNSKGLRFERNRYTVSTPGGSWWYWNGFKTWAQWQALGHDSGGSVNAPR